MNQTRLSKESGTNVSYNSNYSNIKSNILKFKNKKGPVKLPIPIGSRAGGVTTPSKLNIGSKNSNKDSNLIKQYSYKKKNDTTTRKNNIRSMIESTPTYPMKNPKFLKTVNIELNNSSPKRNSSNGKTTQFLGGRRAPTSFTLPKKSYSG